MERVPGLEPAAVYDLFFIHQAYGESRQVVIVLRHHAGVLGSFPADKGAASLHAAFRNPRHNPGDFLREVPAAGDVIQEEQRLCAAAHHVVDAHGHRVNANGVVLVQQHGDFQLGAHAVCAGHQHRLFHALHRRGKQPPKAANP